MSLKNRTVGEGFMQQQQRVQQERRYEPLKQYAKPQQQLQQLWQKYRMAWGGRGQTTVTARVTRARSRCP